MASYKQLTLDARWDVIVIGSGIGGLTVVALLSKHAGKRVLVLERHYTAGARRRRGFAPAFSAPAHPSPTSISLVRTCRRSG